MELGLAGQSQGGNVGWWCDRLTRECCSTDAAKGGELVSRARFGTNTGHAEWTNRGGSAGTNSGMRHDSSGRWHVACSGSAKQRISSRRAE